MSFLGTCYYYEGKKPIGLCPPSENLLGQKFVLRQIQNNSWKMTSAIFLFLKEKEGLNFNF